MALPPAIPASDGSTGARLFGKTRLIVICCLFALMVLCIVFSWTTRGAMSFLRNNRSATSRGAQRSQVDLQPWQTAQALAPLAVTAEEIEYARDAERLADHEVDQAFAAALRQARLETERRALTGEVLALSQKVTQIEQLKHQDQALVASLTAQAGASNGGQPPDNDDLEVAKAQLGLDNDELADAQEDLDRASGDHSTEIQEELAAHEAAMREYDNGTQNSGQIAVLSAARNGTLASRLNAWFSQSKRQGLIEEALERAQSDVNNLSAEHNALEASANTSVAGGAAPDRATQVADLKNRGIVRQILSIDDDRIQTEQQLAVVYSKWEAQVKLQHQILLHLILQSVVFILFILIAMLVCDALVRHFMSHTTIERRRMRTLRNILGISIQAVGIILILLVIFGSPRETPTILGLATAALGIVLQDYILAFLGWFILMGKNGIHVGDWVEINGVNGEVTEVGLITTTLLETGGMADQGHPTGRRISFMNGFAIRGQYFNFSTAGQWMWDEILVSVPASVDIHNVMEQVQKAVLEETEENSRLAEQEWKRAAHEEGLGRYSSAAVVNLRPSGSGIDLQIRYVISAYKRFDLRNRLYQRVFDLLHEPTAAAK
jgi:small-conductance mechanosensitive channel